MALLLSAEVRHGRWALATGLIRVDFSKQAAHVRPATGPSRRVTDEIGRQASLGLARLLWSVAAGYRVVDQGRRDGGRRTGSGSLA